MRKALSKKGKEVISNAQKKRWRKYRREKKERATKKEERPGFFKRLLRGMD